MKWSLFYVLSAVFMSFMAVTTADLSITEQTIASFYSNLKILSAGEYDDASYEAGESCIAMVASDQNFFFPNEFKMFGIDGSHDEQSLIFSSYVAQFRKMAASEKKGSSHSMQFSYRIVETIPFYEAEWKKADNEASFFYCIVEKKYGTTVYNGIIRDTVLVNSNKKILGIRNFAGGEAYTGHNVISEPGEDGSGPSIPYIDVARLEVDAAKFFTNKQYVKAFNTYQQILVHAPDNANAYYRLALMSYRRQGCTQFSRKETDKMAMEYIDQAYDHGDWALKRKVQNIKYYW